MFSLFKRSKEKDNMDKKYEAYLNSSDKTKEIDGYVYYKPVCLERVTVQGKKAVKIVLPTEIFEKENTNKVVDEIGNVFTLTNLGSVCFDKGLPECFFKTYTYYIFSDPNSNTDDIGSFFRAVSPEWRWALVGNIVETHEYGENHEIRYGTKQFPPGAKVYIAPPNWGDGWENVIVIGVPRKSKKYIEIVMPCKYIENFRIQKVFKPAILRIMFRSKYWWWDDSDNDRDTILGFIDS